MLLNSDKQPALLNMQNQNEQRDKDGDYGRQQQYYQHWKDDEDNLMEGAADQEEVDN